MNWKKWTVIVVSTLFMIGNLYLIYKKDSEIKRLSFVDTWTTVREQNLVESQTDAGLITPIEEEYIYYGENTGDLKAFLVKEGDRVEENTPILELSSVDIDAAIAQRELEISRLEDDIEALEDNIDSLDDLLSDIESSTTDENQSSNTIMANSLEIEIYEKELQVSRLEAELDKQETALASMDESLSSLTINSKIAGIVKEIRHDLNNPIVTITSNDIQVEATLTEKEIPTLEEGMKVVISSSLHKDKLEGTISTISTLPKTEPKEKKETLYSYTIQLNEQPSSSIPHGSNVDLKIITNEINDALTVLAKSIKQKGVKSYLYVMKANGTIERRQIETGLQLNHVREIKANAEEGEKVVLAANTLRNKTKFYTSFKPEKLKKKDFRKMGKRQALKTALKGFVS
ncbi:efflux RND transporter periplasmic adaptor subunit [Robertmurraya korlensis]|uniref:efflux RND transporter periplasmic adaptor subunit n=1 Tax=Robertmurraya korlensis TaxID=519977 RepID=UPI000824154B|nr:efflux RND transporter periplasmic adaptor subunit [Robertmurraya korlensis]